MKEHQQKDTIAVLLQQNSTNANNLRDRFTRLQENAKNAQRSETTKIMHGRHIKSLLGRFKTINEIINWFQEQISNPSPSIRRGTLQVYKSALKHHINENILLNDLEKLNLMNRLISINPYHMKQSRTIKRGSTARSKHITQDDFLRLFDGLINHSSIADKSPNPNADNKWAERTAWFLFSNMYTGARPSEWSNAHIFIETKDVKDNVKLRTYIRLPNHKTNKQNSTSKIEYRIIPIPDSKIKGIEYHMTLIKEWLEANPERDFSHYQDRCSRTLHSIYTALFLDRKKHITLYSGRHQFHADMEAGGLSLSTILERMGHSSVINDRVYGGHLKSKRNQISTINTITAPLNIK